MSLPIVKIIDNENNEYHNNQGTIVIHCKHWLFYFIPNLYCYNKLKIPCLEILLQKQNDNFRTSFFYVPFRHVMQLQWMFHSLFMINNEIRIFKLKLYTNFLLVTCSCFTSSRAREIKNHKNDDVKNGYMHDCIEHFISFDPDILWLCFA